MSLLGKGGLATVVKISDQYALKVLSDVRAAQEEAAILDVLGQSSTVVGFHGRLGEDFGASLQHTALLLELCQGSVSDLLSGLGSQRLPNPTSLTTQQYVVMMINCLAQLHSRGVIHQDIKPSNFLFGRDGSIKLCDFNLSRLANDSTRPSSGGTVLYFSPQKFSNTEDGYAADWWALGVTLYQLLHGLQTWPFSSRSLRRLAQMPASEQLTWVRKAVFKGNLRFRPLSGLPRAARTLIRGLLHPQSELRWGLLQALAGDYPADQAFSAVALRYPHLASDMERLLAVRRLCRSGSSLWQPVPCMFENQAAAVAGTQREVNPRRGRACHSLRAFSSCLLSGRKLRDNVAMTSVTMPAAGVAAVAFLPRRPDGLPPMNQFCAMSQQQQPLQPGQTINQEQMEQYVGPYNLPDTSRSGAGVGSGSIDLVMRHSPKTPPIQQLAPCGACPADSQLFFEQRKKVRCFTGALASALVMRKSLMPRSDTAARAAAAVAAAAPPPLLLTPDGRLVAAPFIPCEIRTHVVDLAAIYRVLAAPNTAAGAGCEDSGPQEPIGRVQGSPGGGQVQGVEVLEEMRVMLERRRLSARYGAGTGNGATSQTSDRLLHKAVRRASCCETAASTLALAPEGPNAVAMWVAARKSSPGAGSVAETNLRPRDDSRQPAAVEVLNAQHIACARSSRHSCSGSSSSSRAAEPSPATQLNSWQQQSPIVGDSNQDTTASTRRSAQVTGCGKQSAEKVLTDTASAAFGDSEAVGLSAVGAAAELLSPFTRYAFRHGVDCVEEAGGMSCVSHTATTSAAPRRLLSLVDSAQHRGPPADRDASGSKGHTHSAQSIFAMRTSCPQSLSTYRAAAAAAAMAAALAGHEKRHRCSQACAFHAPPLQLPQLLPSIGSGGGPAEFESRLSHSNGCGPRQAMGRRSGSCSCDGCSDDLAGGDGDEGGIEDGSSLFSLPLATVRSTLEALQTGVSTRAAALASEGSSRKTRNAFNQPQPTERPTSFPCLDSPGPFGTAAAAALAAAAMAAAAPVRARSTWTGKAGSVLPTSDMRKAFVLEEGKTERRSWGSGTAGDLGFCTVVTPSTTVGSMDGGADGAVVTRSCAWRRLQQARGLTGTADVVAVSSDLSVSGLRPAAAAVCFTAAVGGTSTSGGPPLPRGEQLLAAARGAAATPASPPSSLGSFPAPAYSGRSPHSTSDDDDDDTTSIAMRSSAPTAGSSGCWRHGHVRKIRTQRLYEAEGGGDGNCGDGGGSAASAGYRTCVQSGNGSNRLCRFQSRGLMRAVKQGVV
ncbi:hypothetical protein VaNZ11_008095 [Volvox africanus]|uniref:Protein kinase domain-containing protein n=1 Tax=Volvox africanus TaxID=51714 RepID=A0ABQ5S5L2_9CHLO|nr:hypothetical protein VaNZ11_008095 [Volvox africanus]